MKENLDFKKPIIDVSSITPNVGLGWLNYWLNLFNHTILQPPWSNDSIQWTSAVLATIIGIVVVFITVRMSEKWLWILVLVCFLFILLLAAWCIWFYVHVAESNHREQVEINILYWKIVYVGFAVFCLVTLQLITRAATTHFWRGESVKAQ